MVVVVVEQLVSMCCFGFAFGARLGPSAPEAFMACDSICELPVTGDQ